MEMIRLKFKKKWGKHTVGSEHTFGKRKGEKVIAAGFAVKVDMPKEPKEEKAAPPVVETAMAEPDAETAVAEPQITPKDDVIRRRGRPRKDG